MFKTSPFIFVSKGINYNPCNVMPEKSKIKRKRELMWLGVTARNKPTTTNTAGCHNE